MPRIVASLFMNPGGEKFYQMLLGFSRYVLMQEMGHREKGLIEWPVLSSKTAPLVQSMSDMTQCSILKNQAEFLKKTQERVYVQHQWKNHTRFV